MNEKNDQATTPPYVDFTYGGDSLLTEAPPYPPRVGDCIRVHLGDGVKDYEVDCVVWHVNKDAVSHIEAMLTDLPNAGR